MSMNILFLCIFVLSSALVILQDASAFLPVLLEGAGNAVTLSLSLLAAYAVWMGFLQVAQDAGVLRGMSRAMLPLTRRLFGTQNDLDKERYAQEMFFVVNCAGLQLFPSTVLSLRVQAGSAAPLSVLLPALLASLFSLALGILLVRLFCRK